MPANVDNVPRGTSKFTPAQRLRKLQADVRVSGFVEWCRSRGLPDPVAEYRFRPPRRWRFDYCWPEHHVALEEQGGWFLRQCNIWAKPNGMPESVRDRSTASHEYVLHLTKQNDYYYNAAAARTPLQPSSGTRLAQDVAAPAGSGRANGGAKTNGTMKAVARTDKQRGHGRKHAGFNNRWDAMTRDEQMEAGANLRSVWWITPAQYREGHFAVMPDALAEICIACGSERGNTILDPFGGAGTTTRSDNLANSAPHRDSRAPRKGITFRRDTSRWVARIMVRGTVHRLGNFVDPHEAGEAYEAAAKRLRGEF